MEIPLYEDPQVFIRNSAVYFANKLKAPLLLSVGDHDGASDRRQDIELYNSAQRAGKNCVMLVYVGENHSVALKATQLDYHRRINEWFDHYVKSEASGMDRQGRAGAGARAGVEGQRRRPRLCGGRWELVTSNNRWLLRWVPDRRISLADGPCSTRIRLRRPYAPP
jgi:hypothetical protein